MQNTPDDINRPAAVASPDRAKRGNRTAAAGREFLHALGGDLAALARRLRLALTLRRARAARARLPAGTAGGSWAHSGRVLRRLLLFAILGAAAGALVTTGAMLWALHDLPLDKPMGEPERPSLLLEAANGAPLGRVGPLKGADAPLGDFPAILTKAVLSIEDHRFYQHFGVDPLGIARAAHRNMEAGDISEGGSTITQQLVKVRYVGRERTYTRKAREAMAAIWLESQLSKNEILRRYLNTVYLGAGAYGMPAAARLYFNKRPAELSLAEAAMLAGLIKAPSQFNPLNHLEAAQTRAAEVLNAMVAYGEIDAQAASAAKARPATPKVVPQLAPAASWFTDWIATQAANVTGSRKSSVRVRTTLMPDLQRLAEETLEQALAAEGRSLGVSQGAMVVMRPDGAVLAMVGGRDYRTSQFNRAFDAMRQPGSAFKLFVYLAALRKGRTPQDTIDASPIDIKGWEPENYNNAHYGRITLADAFAKSVNTAAVRLAMDVGIKQVIAAARDLGIDTPLSPYPSLALGATSMTLLDLTSAFASVRADRMRLKPWGISAADAPTSGVLLAAQPLAPTQTLDPYQKPLLELLRGVVEHGTGRSAAMDGPVAGKTGTSQDYRDAWFIGFNDKLVVGIWVGNDDNRPMKHVTGGRLPAAIWKQFVTKAMPLVGQQGAPVAAAPAPNATQQAASVPAGAEPAANNTNNNNVTPPAESAPPPPPGAARGNPPAKQAEAEQPQHAGACDQQACAGAYTSFRASDCTYQPLSGGPRRVCEMSKRPGTAEQVSQETTGAAARAPHCNVEACSKTYSSFNASDCTYQPFSGGRRQVCEK